MLRTGQTGHSESAAFLLLYLVAAVMNILMQMTAYLTGLPAVVYCFLLIAWGASVYLRIVHRRIRRDVIAIAGFLIGLFIVRLSRYIFFEHSLTIDRYMWYLYYIPYITMPMLTLDAASCVGKSERTKMPVIIGVLWTAAVLLMLGVLTNDLHHFLLRFGDMHDYSGTVMYNWLYVLVAVWIFSVTLGAFILLIMRCRLSQCRKYWYIPVIFASIGVALILLYYAVGGSPEIGGIKLYQIQEVYVLLFVGLWESCIRIGLIPSNSGYNTLFELSHINAALLNTDGETVYHAKGYSDTADDSDFLVRRQKIKGGWVIWNEDISAVSRINSELAEATERIEEENDLIEEENRFTAEKVRYETQNRLYDHIAEHTHARLVEIDEALADMDDFDLRMKFCLLLGTYVKRCSNLMLIADKSPVISTDELYLSIRESFEHMRFLGIDCEIISVQSRKLPAAQIIAAYDLFESVIESILDSVSACSVRVMPAETVLMTIETDGPAAVPDKCSAPELILSSFVEDDMQRITLSVGGDGHG